jgi:hypothetical protein
MTQNQTPLDVAFSNIFNSLLFNVHTALPAEVTAFDAVTQTCSVQPVIKRLTTVSDSPELLPIIEDVPVVYPGGGDFFITFELAKGSYVLLICAERSIANWMTQGGQVDPESTRKFTLSDAIAIPGLLPLPKVLLPPVHSGGLVLRNKLGTTKITVSDTEIILENALGTVTLKASGQLDVNGNFTVDV